MLKTRVFLRPLVPGLLALTLGNCTCHRTPEDTSSSSSSGGDSSSAGPGSSSRASGSGSSSRGGSSSHLQTSSTRGGSSASSTASGSGASGSSAPSGPQASSGVDSSGADSSSVGASSSPDSSSQGGSGASGSSGAHVNVVPVITGQGTVSILEDSTRTILLTDLVVVDPDNAFPADFVLSVAAGDHYTLSGADLRPEQDFFGTLAVPVTVSDGADPSAAFFLQVSVTPVNDPPRVVGQQALTALSGGTLEVTLGDVRISDVDSPFPGAFRLLALPGNHFTVMDTASGFILTVEAGFAGMLEVPITAHDGVDAGPVFSLQVGVVAAGVLPVITGQNMVQTPEDTPVALTLSDLQVTGASPPSAVVKVLAGANYTVVGSQVVPARDFNGVLHVPVRVFNGTLDSAVFDLIITVTPVNDPPTVTAHMPLQMDEDTSLAITLADVTVVDVDNAAAAFILTVSPGDHYTVDAGGTLVPAADFFGTLSVNVTVSDGTLASAPYAVPVDVLPVNDPPVVTGQSGVGVVPGMPRALGLLELTVVDVDNTFPTGFTLTVLDGAGYTHTGNTFTLDATSATTVSVTVTVNDGAADSTPYLVSVNVLSAPNVAPVITGQVALTTAEDAPLALDLSQLAVTDPDTAPASLSLVVSAGPHHTVVSNTVVPEPNFNGILDVVVVVNDGLDSSAPFTLHITVTPAADPPVITATPGGSSPEDTAFTLGLADVSVVDVDTPAAQLTFSVQDGAHYTHAGNVVTPDLDFNGPLPVNFVVTDGDTAPVAGVVPRVVTPVNDLAVITADAVADLPEDSSLALGLGMFNVTDPDGPVATLVIDAGPNHVVVGDTVFPAPNFTGELLIPVRIFDGVDLGPVYTLSVMVTPLNDPPVITAQLPLTTLEDTPLTLTLADLVVVDPDNAYPTGFTLSVDAAAHCSVAGNVITPEADYSGAPLQVTVRVNDGAVDSAPFTITISVTPVNDPPVVTAQNALEVLEDGTLTLTVADFVVTDVDGPTAQLADVLPGLHHTVSGTTVIPDANYAGNLQVIVRVTDGTATSADFMATVVVTPVNDLPVITGQLPLPLTATEDTAFSPTLANFTVTDVDDSYPTGFTMVVEPGSNYATNGTTVTPSPDFNGNLTVGVHVVDGAGGASLSFGLAVTVASVNDAPIITGQNPTPLVMVEDTPFTLTLANLQAADMDHTYPTGFTLQLDAGANCTVSGSVITPAANFSGTLTVGVRVVDPAGAPSNTFNVVAQVAASNDAPIITAQTPSPVVTLEDAAFTLTLASLVVTDVDNTYPTGFTLTASPGANYTLGSVTATSVVVTPSANHNGPLLVPLVVTDPGGLDSNAWVVQVTVTSVNDLPVITAQVPNPLTTNEDTPLDLLLTQFSVTDVDHPGYPTGFSLQVAPGTNYTVSGVRVTPAPNFSGTLTVPVTVTDPAGGASTAFNATVAVAAVNDPPVITAQVPAPLPATEDTPFNIQLTQLLVMDVDHAGYPAGFTLQVGSGSNYSVAGSTVTPAANHSGPLSVPVTVTDPAGGVSSVFNVQVNVAPVNDPPGITAQLPNPFSIPEDTALALTLAAFSVVDVDNAGYPAGFSLQLAAGANYTFSGTTVTPLANFNGPLTVPVTVTDPSGGVSATFNALVVVTPVNDPPSITAQVPSPLAVAEDTPLSILLTHLMVTDVDNPGYPAGFTLQVGAGANYALAGATLTPAANYNGALTVPVTVTDPAGAVSSTFSLVVTVTPVNDPPVITGSSTPASINEDTPFTVLLSHFTVTDPDNTYPTGFTLTLSNCVNCTVAGAVVTPTANFFSGAPMTVDAVVFDGSNTSNVRTLSFTVNAVNDPPVAGADAITTTGNTLKTVAAPGVLANDSDVDSVGLTATAGILASAAGGTATLAADGSYTFLPATGFTGTDTFNYSVNDPQGGTAVGTVSVQVVGLVWYVQASYVGVSTGRSSQPFSTLAQTQTGSTANSTIYLRTGAYNGNLTLKAGQRLAGAGVALVLAPNNPDVPAGTRPSLANAAGGVITLNSANNLEGFNITAAAGNGIGGNNVGTLRVADVDVSNTRVGILVATSNATVTLERVNVTTVVNTGLGTGRGLAMSNARLAFTDVVVDAAAITALEVFDAAGASTFTNLTVKNNGQDGIYWQNTGAAGLASATFNNLLVNGTNDPGSAVILRSDASVVAGANMSFTFNGATIQNVRGFGDGFNAAAEGTGAILTLNLLGSTLDNTVAGAGAGSNGIRVNAAAPNGTVNLTLNGNTLRRWLNDTISMESGSFSTLTGTLTNNVVGDTVNAAMEGSVNGDGISLLMDGPLSGAGTSTAAVTFGNNRVRNVLGLGFNVESRGPLPGARVKATFSGNVVDAMTRSAVRPSLRVRSRDLTVMCASFAGDNMATPTGGAEGSQLQQLNASTYYRTTVPAGTVSTTGLFNPGMCPF